MEITTDQVKQLRDATGVSVMVCKKALEEAGGDFDQAVVILRKKAGASAAKKADRELGSGSIATYVHTTKDVAAMVELRAETDFVAKNEDFIATAYNIAMHVAATNPKFIKRSEVTPEATKAAEAVFTKELEGKPEEMKAKILAGKIDSYIKDFVLMDQSYIKDPSKTIHDIVSEATQKFGERIEITRIARFSTKE